MSGYKSITAPVHRVRFTVVDSCYMRYSGPLLVSVICEVSAGQLCHRLYVSFTKAPTANHNTIKYISDPIAPELARDLLGPFQTLPASEVPTPGILLYLNNQPLLIVASANTDNPILVACFLHGLTELHTVEDNAFAVEVGWCSKWLHGGSIIYNPCQREYSLVQPLLADIPSTELVQPELEPDAATGSGALVVENTKQSLPKPVDVCCLTREQQDVVAMVEVLRNPNKGDDTWYFFRFRRGQKLELGLEVRELCSGKLMHKGTEAHLCSDGMTLARTCLPVAS